MAFVGGQTEKNTRKIYPLFEEKCDAELVQNMLTSTSNVYPLENVTQINTGSADKVIVKVKYMLGILVFI